MYCQFCGHENTDDAQICVNCKKALHPTASPVPRKKKKKTGRIILVVIVAIFVLFWLIGTLGSKSTSSTDTNSPVTEASGNSEISAQNVENTAGEIGDYIVTIKEAKVVENTYDSSDILVVTYSFTNNSKDAKAFIYAVSDTLFQNGVEIQSVLTKFGIEDEYDFDNKSKEIQPGITLDVQCAYELADTTSDVDVEITEWISFTDEKLTYTINLNEIN